MIELINVAFHYGRWRKRYVLKGLNLKVRKGEFVAITGRSGCGKTTLLKVISGLVKPQEGYVVLNGRRVKFPYDIRMSRFRLNHIGLVYQTFELSPDLSVIDNVLLPVYLSGGKVRDSKKRAVELLDYLGMSQFLKSKPMELSGGQQQRVALARALINDPEIILADEPTANLDPESSERIISLLLKLHSDGKTLVFVSHQKEVWKKAEVLYRMEDGKLEKI